MFQNVVLMEVDATARAHRPGRKWDIVQYRTVAAEMTEAAVLSLSVPL